MSLIDGSPRGATCRAAEPSGVASLGLQAYRRPLTEPGEAGCAFRHLLLAGISQQLNASNARVQRMSARSDESDGHTLTETSIILQGWST